MLMSRKRLLSGYDVAIKLYQHHMMERVIRIVEAINVLNVFCSCYTAISAVSHT